MRIQRRLIAWTGLILAAASLTFGQKDPKTLKYPDLEFKPQRPGQMTIKKGIQLYFKESSDFPAITGYLILKAGSLRDPQGKEGLAALTMTLLKSGGTRSLIPDKVEEKLDFLGSTVYCRAADEFSYIYFWSLKKNFNETWGILTDILFNPVFNKERFETEKQKELENIRRRWDQPMMIGMYLYNELVYGKDYPDARRTMSSGINAISIDDIKNFYEKNLKDREIIMVLTGDFDVQETQNLLSRTFRDWKGKPPDKFTLPKATLAAKPGVYLINKEDMTQAIVTMGHLGINRLDPDNVEIAAMNFILGSGGFNSRIMREVRSNRGLAYAAFGSVEGGRDLGVFFNFCQTKNQSVGESIGLIRDIIADMTKNPVTEAELNTAKKYQQNAFIHRFDSPLAVLWQYVFLKLQGFPDDFLESYIPRTKKVDATKVLEMAKRTMHPESLVILVVGKKSEILNQLQALNLGEVKELPLPKE